MPKNVNSEIEAMSERMLTTLERKTDPSHTALIVVDVQNDYCAKGGALDEEGQDIRLIQVMVPRLLNFIRKAREVGLTIIYSRSVYSWEGGHYMSEAFFEQQTRWARGRYTEYPFCKQGSWGTDFYDGIAPLPEEVVVSKHRFSAFTDTDLDLILRSRGIRTLIMTGVTTNVCVETTIRDGFCRDYYIVLLNDCTAAVSEELHNNSVRTIELYFGEVVDSRDVLTKLSKEVL